MEKESHYPPQVRSTKYASSADPRGYLPVWEYEVNGQTIMWDRQTGYVHFTGIWKALGNNKADIVRLVEMYPALEHTIRKIRGGTLKLQGTWLPSQTARRLAERTCWPIRYSLTPLFGETFPEACWPPDRPGYGQLALENEMRGRRRAIPQRTVSARLSHHQIKLCKTPSPKSVVDNQGNDLSVSPGGSSPEGMDSDNSDYGDGDQSMLVPAPWTQGPEHHQLLAGYDGYKSGSIKKPSTHPIHTPYRHDPYFSRQYAPQSVPGYVNHSARDYRCYEKVDMVLPRQVDPRGQAFCRPPTPMHHYNDLRSSLAHPRAHYRPYHDIKDHENTDMDKDNPERSSADHEMRGDCRLAPLRSSMASSSRDTSEKQSDSSRNSKTSDSPDAFSRTLPPLATVLEGTYSSTHPRHPPPRRRSSEEQTYGSFASTSQFSRDSSPVHTPNLREHVVQGPSYFENFHPAHPYYTGHTYHDRTTLSCSRDGREDIPFYPWATSTSSYDFHHKPEKRVWDSSTLRWLPKTSAMTGPHSLSAYRLGPRRLSSQSPCSAAHGWQTGCKDRMVRDELDRARVCHPIQEGTSITS